MNATELRVGCPATRHDTVTAYERRGCTCPAAIAAIRASWQKRRRHTRSGPRQPNRLRRGDRYEPVLVDRACSGWVEPLTVAEMTAAVARLTARGDSAKQIAAVLRINSRTVQAYRARARTTRTDRRAA
jgi:DNA-binding NarL/FixJ family response regulator